MLIHPREYILVLEYVFGLSSLEIYSLILWSLGSHCLSLTLCFYGVGIFLVIFPHECIIFLESAPGLTCWVKNREQWGHDCVSLEGRYCPKGGTVFIFLLIHPREYILVLEYVFGLSSLEIYSLILWSLGSHCLSLTLCFYGVGIFLVIFPHECIIFLESAPGLTCWVKNREQWGHDCVSLEGRYCPKGGIHCNFFSEWV